jgi:ADP-ribosylglycohydrolase
MIGAIIGDYVGSAYEFHNTKDYNFEIITPASEITDDSIMSIAIADAILQGKPYAERMRYWGNEYPTPKGAYGGSFSSWLHSSSPQPYNSWGNGSAMRVSPIGWAFDSLEQTLLQAKLSAECTHNHEEGIKGAQATATAIFLARQGETKQGIKKYIESKFGYNLSFKIADIKDIYKFDESCQGTVPPAIVCYLESTSFEDAIRLAVSLGGDSDTLGCITGSIAEADHAYSIPAYLQDAAFDTVPSDLAAIVEQFTNKYRV